MGLTQEIISSKVYYLWFVVYIMVVCVAVLLPSKPGVLTDFFASEHAGRQVSCEGFAVNKEPEYCRNAHSDAVWWASFSDFFSNSVVAFLLAPLAGGWSDRCGRKHLIGLFLCIGSVAPLILALHVNYGLSLYYYFPAQAFSGYAGLASLCSAYVSDKISPANRAAAMGLNLGGFMLAFICGPVIGGFVGLKAAAWIGVGGTLTSIVALWIIVPESLSQAARDKAMQNHKAESRWEQAPWNKLKILLREKLYTKLAIVVFIAGFVAQGFLELLAQYLQLKLGYNKLDLVVVMVLAGSTGLIAQTLVLRALLTCLGECQILLISIAARLIEQVVLCVAWSRVVVSLAICFGAVATLMMPVCITLLSKNVAVYEQGKAQGALYGLLALSQGLGPLAFAYLFSGFTRSDSRWPYIPGAPYLFGAALMLVCGVVALFLDKACENGLQEQTQFHQEMTEAIQASSSGIMPASTVPAKLQRKASHRLAAQKCSSMEPPIARSSSQSQDPFNPLRFSADFQSRSNSR